MTKGIEVLNQLSPVNLRALAISFRDGPLSLGLSAHAISQATGIHGDTVLDCLERFIKDGMAPRHIALLLESIAITKEQSFDPAVLFELVLSGPDVPGVPTEDTAATFQTLVQEAQQEILLVGYTVHGGENIFKPLMERLRGNPNLKIMFFLDISRKLGDTSLESEIVRRFAHEFRQKHWPWPELPELFYDPRALSKSFEERASLHAKCVVVDRRSVLVTSANFTEAGQRRNIELGVLIRHKPIAGRIATYFEGLRVSGILIPYPLE